MQIISEKTTDADFAYVSDKLTVFTLKKGAPLYNPLSRTFRAAALQQGVMGEAIVTEIWGSVNIDLLYVESDYRGKGIGTALMRAIENFALGAGHTSLMLTTPTWQGAGFYERLGFQLKDRLPLNVLLNGMPQYKMLYTKHLIPTPSA